MEYTEESSVVGYYGANLESAAMESIYGRLVEWFESLDHPPRKLGVRGEGFSGKVGSFSRINGRLLKAGFDGVESFSLFALVPGGEVPVWDWCVTAGISRKRARCIFGARTSLAHLSADSLFPIARTIAELSRPNYGIGFRRAMKRGPDLYAGGLVMGHPPQSREEEEEHEDISRWGDTGVPREVYRDGILRDVYPWNFLTESQLSRRVKRRMSLEEWIRADSARGSLAEFTDEMLHWNVEESQIPSVRSVLERAGILFSAKKSKRGRS